MNSYTPLSKFRYWCHKVLPLVYDDSLSYYEILCKVVDYINNMINNQKAFDEELSELSNELKVVQEWIDNYDTDYVKKLVEDFINENLAKMIFVGINDSGYIVYYIPESWKDITFQTTGLDVAIPNTEYGRLVLNY